MLLYDNCNGGYHLFCLKSKFTQVPTNIWYCSSCSLATPWFLLKTCHAFPGLGLGGDTWEYHFNFFLCIVYICVWISFWLISFYFWMVLVFFFGRVYYGFTPLRHHTSRHYMSQHRGLMLWNKSQDHGEESRLHYDKHLIHLLRKNLASCNMPHSPLS
jgi:hypothetical protein